MRFNNSKQYKNADPKLVKQFLGLKSKRYDGRPFVIDEGDARLIVANLPKYGEFKRLYRKTPATALRVLQDIEYEGRGHRASPARELISKGYGGSKNFMTPHVVKVGKISRNQAYEISTGRGIEGQPIYGVSVVRKFKGKVKPVFAKGKLLYSREAAEAYAKSLKRR
jgi:hypothetical protein